MEIKLQGINLTQLAAEGGDLSATIKGIYDDKSFADFRIVGFFTFPKKDPGDATKTVTELVLIFQTP